MSKTQKSSPFLQVKHNDLLYEVKSKLAEWAVSFNVPHNTLNGLLPIIKYIPGLSQMPIDAPTILNCSNIVNKAIPVIDVRPGYYYHFGLGLAVKRHFSTNLSIIYIS